MTATQPHDELGAHVSNAGGIENAPGRAAALHSNVLQLFTKQPSRWAEPVFDDARVAAFRSNVVDHDIRAMSAHDSYLINLASPDATLRARSIDCFRGEALRCAALGIPYIVSHPGNATDDDVPSAIARNAEAVAQVIDDVPDVTVLLETTAGAGRVLGASFEQLAEIIAQIPSALQSRIGVCVDTCHVFAAGYDLASHYDDVLSQLDGVIGIDRVGMFHLNDSQGALGSRRDRHAHIGEGALGEEPFRRLVTDPRLGHIPKVLETPKDGDPVAADLRNLARLRGYRSAGI